MKRVLLAVLMGCMLLPCMAAGETRIAEVLGTGHYNVRVEPDAGSARAGVADGGREYELLDVAENGWLLIRLDENTTGYISPSLAVESVTESPVSLAADEVFTFGLYEQDNDLENGMEPIEWRILEVKDGEVLLISVFALDAKPYNQSGGEALWAQSSLRSWLSHDFYDLAFSVEEKASIITHTLKNWEEPDTEDPVFLLDCDQAKHLFKDHADRQAAATRYAIANGAYVSKKYGKNVHWWLRTHSWEHSTFGAFVATSGGVMTCGGEALGKASNGSLAVRPCIYVDAAILERQ